MIPNLCITFVEVFSAEFVLATTRRLNLGLPSLLGLTTSPSRPRCIDIRTSRGSTASGRSFRNVLCDLRRCQDASNCLAAASFTLGRLHFPNFSNLRVLHGSRPVEPRLSQYGRRGIFLGQRPDHNPDTAVGGEAPKLRKTFWRKSPGEGAACGEVVTAPAANDRAIPNNR